MTAFTPPVGRELGGDEYGKVYSISSWVVIDGLKAPCGVDDLESGQPTVLDGLTLSWGRETAVDQPDTQTCSFVMREQVVDVPGEGVNVIDDPGFTNPEKNATRFPPSWANSDGIVTAGADTAFRENLAFDPSFKTLDGIVSGGAAILADGGAGFSGSTCLRISRNIAVSNFPTAYITNTGTNHTTRPTVFEPGKTYTCSIYVKADAGGADSNTNARRLNAILINTDGTSNTSWRFSEQAVADSAWHRVSITFTVPDTADVIQLRAVSNYSLPTYWDALLVEEGDTLNSYIDDDYPAPGADSYRVWLIGDKVAVPAPGGPPPPAPGNGAMPVTPGKQYLLTIIAKASVDRESRWQVATYNAAGAVITSTMYVASNTPMVAGAWTEISGIWTVPEGVAYAAFAFVPEGGYGGTVEFRNPSISLTSQATFDLIHVGSNVEVWAQAFFGYLPNGAPSLRTMIVWTGEVTSMSTQAAGKNGFTTQVTATDVSSILQNARVGDQPWPAQTVQARANKIMSLIPGAPPLQIDPTIQGVQVSYRDVDAQPPMQLLQDLAQSAGGVLWVAANADNGAYLFMEDPTLRSAVRRFAIDENGAVYISDGRGGDVGPGDIRIVSSCDVLQEPVTWTQDVSEVVTQVTVTWLEQVVDDDGKPAPEERAVVVQDDPETIERHGVRNVDVATELTSEPDAVDLAGRILAMSRGVGWRADGLEHDAILLQRDIATVAQNPRTGTVCDILDATIRIGLAFTLIDMPEWTPAGAVRSMYLDGGTYTFENGRWHLSLTATPSAGQGSSATWADFKGTGVTWEDFRPNQIRWVDAYGTAGPLTGVQE